MNRWELEQLVEALEALMDAKISERQTPESIEAQGNVVTRRILVMDEIERVFAGRLLEKL